MRVRTGCHKGVLFGLYEERRKNTSTKAHLGKPRAAKPRVLISAQDLKIAGLPKGVVGR